MGIAPATLLYLYEPQRAFGMMIGISAFGAMFAWMMIFVTHLAFAGDHGPAPSRFACGTIRSRARPGAAAMGAIRSHALHRPVRIDPALWRSLPAPAVAETYVFVRRAGGGTQ